jgi:HAD superfamily hydrolase (TIGR01450 family)
LLADRFDAFFLDLDGVVYVGKRALPNTIPALQRLRKQGKHIRFLTNNPCKTRARLVERLRDMGIQAEKEEMTTATWATCLYLRQQGVRSVYPIGSPDMLLELAEVGIAVDEESPDAVVVGCEDEATYAHILQATRLIRRGARFVATMVDAWYPSADGPRPATGAIVAAIQVGSGGHHPIVVGKPSPTMFIEAQQGLPELDPARIVMIGDTPTSDILGAHQAGLSAILISRAAPDTRLFPGAHDLRQPDAIIPDLSALFDTQYTIRPWEPVTYSWPQQISPGVAAIVLDDHHRVLLVRRSDNGLWSLPMGHVEPTETVEEAIGREVFEETGLRVQVQRLSGVYSEPGAQVFTYPSGEVVHFITTGFRCEIIDGEPRGDQQETQGMMFADPRKLPEPFLPGQRQWITDALAETERAFIR